MSKYIQTLPLYRQERKLLLVGCVSVLELGRNGSRVVSAVTCRGGVLSRAKPRVGLHTVMAASPNIEKVLAYESIGKLLLAEVEAGLGLG